MLRAQHRLETGGTSVRQALTARNVRDYIWARDISVLCIVQSHAVRVSS
jgi:hypothetical protein